MQQTMTDLVIPGDVRDIKLPADMANEEILVEVERLDYKIEELEAAKAIFKEELLGRLNAEKVNAIIVGDKSVSKVSRIVVKTPFSYAEQVGATKMVIDTDALKKLHFQGVKVPDIEKVEYVLIKTIKGSDE